MTIVDDAGVLSRYRVPICARINGHRLEIWSVFFWKTLNDLEQAL
jgi:hypothetical protein